MRRLLIVLVSLFVLMGSASASAVITSPYGWRVHPVTGEYKFHAGIDIGYGYGEDIVAMMPGRVVYAAEYGGYGNCIIIEHAGGDHTLYAHCSRFYVNYGQYVQRGTVIAAVGDSGITTGPHLHLEWWHNGHYADPIKLWG